VNAVDAAKQSIEAGLDVDLSGVGFGNNLLEAVKSGQVGMQNLDRAVARLLYQKFALGLFERPYVDEHLVAQKVATPENTDMARNVARESIVLLKNEIGRASCRERV